MHYEKEGDVMGNDGGGESWGGFVSDRVSDCKD